ncbi:uncharacterized protein LOC111308031 [Durio zibethinus]|uniref:Uncharacterized protein LOC111308031 n=1 Tax=Durio zibethinus TaxID=66656 RepID=A0A6P6ABH1_DURZI|nr:uncharacterized protein LOC111308031 [Durio zibethinus]
MRIKMIMVTQMTLVIMMMRMMIAAIADDTNGVFSPCEDSKVQKSDGFTFGLAFSKKEFFFFDNIQLSPCDNRLALGSTMAQLAVFRPKVDEISLLTINGSIPVKYLHLLKFFIFTLFLDGKWKEIFYCIFYHRQMTEILAAGGSMVAFAGRKYAARSFPAMVADDQNTITSFTLVCSLKIGLFLLSCSAGITIWSLYFAVP